MDKLKSLINTFTGGDGKLDLADIAAQVGGIDLTALQDLNFPAGKDEVLETLRANGASSLLIGAIERVPVDTFNSLGDLRGKLPF